MNKHSIMIAGAGGIGHAAAVILSNYKAEDLDIFIGDRFLENAEKSASEINSKTGRSVCSPFLFPEEGENVWKEQMSFLIACPAVRRQD